MAGRLQAYLVIGLLFLFQLLGTVVHADTHNAEHITAAASYLSGSDHNHIAHGHVDADHMGGGVLDHDEESPSHLIHHAIHAASSIADHVQLFAFDHMMTETTQRPTYHFDMAALTGGDVGPAVPPPNA